MPLPLYQRAQFVHGSIYHIFNRCVKGQLLFYSAENYRYFLDQLHKYMSDLMHIYCWSLLPNHFHLLSAVKEESECRFNEKEKRILEQDPALLTDLISMRFKNFFLSHSMAIKNENDINTNVFAQKFKHIRVDKDPYLAMLVYYIHFNPAKHGVTADWQNYRWSSYQKIINGDFSISDVSTVLEWFGGLENFIKYHQVQWSGFDCGFCDE
jgi:REP element-mobilizing transposase RayT